MYLVFEDGSRHVMPNQYMIAPYKKKYLRMSAQFIDKNRAIDATFTGRCDECSSSYDQIVVSTVFLSEDKELNHKLERPGRVCAICYYRRYHELGHSIPPPIKALF